MAKAGVTAFPVCIILLLGGTAVWRDQTQRQVTVEVSPAADRNLLAAGLDLDLRQALIDTLNMRVRGVEAVAATGGLVQRMDTDPQEAISFKAFGSALSTDQVTTVVRFILGSRRPVLVKFDLICGLQPCGQEHGLEESARLVVTMETPGGVQRTTYPLTPGGGLARSVNAAISRTADTLLERTEPLLAGIYDFNLVSSALFADAIRHDIDVADGLATALRGGPPGQACIAGIITATAELSRGQLQGGLTALADAGALPGAACHLRVASQTAGLLAITAACAADPDTRDAGFRQLSSLVAKMPSIAAGAPHALADRVPGSRMILAAAQLMREVDGGTRDAMCSKTANSASGKSTGLARAVTSLLASMRRELPPNASPAYERLVLDFAQTTLDYGVHADDLVSRYVIAHGMADLVRDYAVAARQPRHLRVLQGKLAMEGIRLAHAALALPQADKQAALIEIGIDPHAAQDADGVLLRSVEGNLGVARAAFEAAASAHTATLLEEPTPDIETLVLLGDALALAGDTDGARQAYANGLAAFVADGEKLDQLAQLSQLVSHRTVLLVADGGCSAGATLDEQWEAQWAKLDPKGDGACTLQSAPTAASGHSLLDIIRPLAADVVMHCRLGADAGSPDRQVSWDARMALADCESSHGAGDARLLLAFTHRNSAAVETAIARALSGIP